MATRIAVRLNDATEARVARQAVEMAEDAYPRLVPAVGDEPFGVVATQDAEQRQGPALRFLVLAVGRVSLVCHALKMLAEQEVEVDKTTELTAAQILARVEAER